MLRPLGVEAKVGWPVGNGGKEVAGLAFGEGDDSGKWWWLRVGFLGLEMKTLWEYWRCTKNKLTKLRLRMGVLKV